MLLVNVDFVCPSDCVAYVTMLSGIYPEETFLLKKKVVSQIKLIHASVYIHSNLLGTSSLLIIA